MNSSFTTGISALRAHSKAFEMISDNISKMNLPGHKYSDTQVQISSSGGGNNYSQLNGMGTNVRTRFAAEGTPIGTNNPLDGALTGSGFFVTSPNLTGGDLLLTEAGQFKVTRDSTVSDDSYLVDPQGNYVMGWKYDPNTLTYPTAAETTASLSAIQINRLSTTYDASASTYGKIEANLEASAETGDAYTVSLGILDGTGDTDGVSDSRNIDTTFTKTATPNLWDVTFSATDGTINTAAVQMQFDVNGNNPTIVGQTGAELAFSASWTNPAVNTDFTLNLNEVKQFAGGFILNNIQSDGFTQGKLDNVYFGDNGVIHGKFTNGQSRPIAKVAVGDVINTDGLYTASSTHFAASGFSGEINIYDPETTTRVRFHPHAYEASTADIGTAFTKMIESQHAYSSAATIIRTVDEMLQTAGKL